MAADGVEFVVGGLEDLKQQLRAMPEKLRKRAILNALRAGGRIYRDEARRLTPAIVVPIRMKNGMIRRAPGTVRKAISVRTSKLARRNGDLGVFINSKPAKGALRGTNKPFDPFYWRFLEFGTNKMPAVGMLTKAAQTPATRITDRVTQVLGPAIVRLNRRQEP